LAIGDQKFELDQAWCDNESQRIQLEEATMNESTVHDPVCHMDITIASAAGRSEHGGQTYYFCSPGCKKDFDADPAGVLQAEAEYDHSQPSEMEMAMPGSGGATATAKRPWWRFWG
jgi:YHS domain-containing protein